MFTAVAEHVAGGFSLELCPLCKEAEVKHSSEFLTSTRKKKTTNTPSLKKTQKNYSYLEPYDGFLHHEFSA